MSVSLVQILANLIDDNVLLLASPPCDVQKGTNIECLPITVYPCMGFPSKHLTDINASNW